MDDEADEKTTAGEKPAGTKYVKKVDGDDLADLGDEYEV